MAVACVDSGTDDDDSDGLTNAQECGADTPTDPNNPDTDGDGILDGDEVLSESGDGDGVFMHTIWKSRRGKT